MQYDDAYAEMGDIASAHAREYALRHSYGIYVSRTVPTFCTPFWRKIHLIRWALENPEWDYIYWMDADTLILDMDFPIDRLRGGKDALLDISTDDWGICAGIFGVRNCDWSHQLLDTWIFLGDVRGTCPGVTNSGDQAPLMLMDKYFASVGDKVNRIPQEVISNPQSKQKGTFMHHWWSRITDKGTIVLQMSNLLT